MTTTIFMHIPKTGGSTFHSILGKYYPKNKIQNIFGVHKSSPEIIALEKRPREELESIRLLKGHLTFGIHRYLPQTCEYITLLRDPVERVISQFYYIKNNPNNPLHEDVHQSGMSIREFVESGLVTGMNNGQARFLTGYVERLPYGDETNLYQDAIENIKNHFSWVGTTEQFDKSILILQNIMGWKSPPYYFKQNVSQSRKKADNFEEHEIEAIKKANSVDIDIYKWAEEQLEINASGIDNFTEKYSRFIKRNMRLYRRYGWIPDSFLNKAIKHL